MRINHDVTTTNLTDIYTHKITSNGDGSYTLTGASGWAMGPDWSDLTNMLARAMVEAAAYRRGER